MANRQEYGPWATMIDIGGNPQLSAFWRQRMAKLVSVSHTSTVLSRQSLLCLLAAGALMIGVPTFRVTAAVAEEEKSARVGKESLEPTKRSPPAGGQTATAKQADPAPAGDAKSQEKALEEFEKLYALKEGEVWKHVAPPYSPARAVYYRNSYPDVAKQSPRMEPDMMLLVWQDEKLKSRSMCIGNDHDLLYPIRNFLDIYTQEIEGDKELLQSSPVQGDWVFREGTPKQQAIAELEKFLNQECNLRVKLSLRDVTRKVFVATGEFQLRPLTSHSHSGWSGIYVYDKKPGRDRGEGNGDLEMFIRDVGGYSNARLVSDLKNPSKDNLRWFYGDGPPDPKTKKVEVRDVANVLKHVTEQTGIVFKEETRTVPVLFVERAK